MIDAAELSTVKLSELLIDVTRGGVVKEADLVQALRNGISGRGRLRPGAASGRSPFAAHEQSAGHAAYGGQGHESKLADPYCE
jgi:hypothetical protein